MTKRTKAGKRIRVDRLTSLIILLFMVLTMSVLNGEFFTIQTLRNLMQQVSAVGVVALGAMFVIIAGGIDFTAGYGLAMVGMIAGTIYTSYTDNVVVFLFAALLGGAALGLVNGLVIAKLKILPFIATLAIMSIAQGLSLLIGGGGMVILTNEQIIWIGQGKVFGFVPVSFLLFLFAGIIIFILLNKTKLGVYTYAIGSNQEAVRYMGINVDRYKILVYIVAGICTGLASLLTVTKIAMATPGIYGTTLLDAIAATVIGGTSITGGKGNVVGTICGVFIIVIISSALTYLKIAPEMQEFFKGTVIFIAIGLDAYVSRVARKV
ncbi:MAG: ABC transporter permease [Dehalococcoidales bacterium]|nr:ABC transporter permease [Dehalococcoidales bacterium]